MRTLRRELSQKFRKIKMTAYSPFETINASDRDDAIRGLVLVCDHASNEIPPGIAPLGLPPQDMARHIAYDVGARDVTLGLADALGGRAVLSRFSRLVIDPNRGEDDPTLVMRLNDGSVIEGNRGVDAAEIARRLEMLHRPYHAEIERALDAAGDEAVLVSMHSFTPQFRGRPFRPWQIALLWDQDDRLVAPLLNLLRIETEYTVGDNEPYSGKLAGDCMWMHGTQRGIPHVLIEIRNDLISDPDGIAEWVELLAPLLRAAIERMRADVI